MYVCAVLLNRGDRRDEREQEEAGWRIRVLSVCVCAAPMYVRSRVSVCGAHLVGVDVGVLQLAIVRVDDGGAVERGEDVEGTAWRRGERQAGRMMRIRQCLCQPMIRPLMSETGVLLVGDLERSSRSFIW